MTALNWTRDAGRRLVQRRGGEPAWLDGDRVESGAKTPRRGRPGKRSRHPARRAAGSELQGRGRAVIMEFAKLPFEERDRQIAAYRARIDQICALQGEHRAFRGVREAERILHARLMRLTKPPPHALRDAAAKRR